MKTIPQKNTERMSGTSYPGILTIKGSRLQTVALHIENLTRRFNNLVAVDNISFDIEHGEIFGLLGPNGAGKTTTLSMLSTMLKPTSGSATVNGIDIEHDRMASGNPLALSSRTRALMKN